MIEFEKTCSKCGKSYPATTEFFHVHAVKNWRGLRPECKACRNEKAILWRSRNKERITEYQKEYYKNKVKA